MVIRMCISMGNVGVKIEPVGVEGGGLIWSLIIILDQDGIFAKKKF